VTRRSPIKHKPLRLPGQSLSEEIQKVVHEVVLERVLLAVVFVVLAGWEWYRWYWPITHQPILVTTLAIGACTWAAFKFVRGRKTIRQLKLGRDGERDVAEVLEEMREKGYKVFHDIKGDDFNVDHLVVGSHGLFVIETKTASKPAKGDAKVRYDGERVTVGGRVPVRGPVQQSSALAKWIGDLVKQSSGRSCFVRPVVLYPGWFVENSSRTAAVWVLNPKMLAGYIEREPVRLGLEDIKLISFHLTRFVKAASAE